MPSGPSLSASSYEASASIWGPTAARSQFMSQQGPLGQQQLQQ
ncbi:hypothetical protein [Sporisorium scitamineum]|uniref:Uncharacterized protein n=1 Tax=Sporisorium scitamineum TaxID=49012 RepID=A0A0F7SAD1_9BASI|nr:hypothetical protein [Sporisorium scitamineum]